ncbi:conserved hypothetical protein [methanotrophic bacterial endosymbiont of Bathymodiolus sp.]|nr:conserved hypothetical protein [methanotrophic bacterial endosymbiont of Bathymodiolus sp.]
MSSPRPWGCFQIKRFLRTSNAVFPTPVGVFLTKAYDENGRDGLPHARGGVSK